MTSGPHGARLHPCQVAFAGRGDLGTSDLVAAVARELSGRYWVALAHADNEGMSVVSIRSATAGSAALDAARFDPAAPAAVYQRAFGLLDHDLVLSVGPAPPDVPTVLVLDGEGGGTAPQDLVATVGVGPPPHGATVPHFDPTDVAGVAAAVRDHLLTLAARRPLHGLVLVGGRSTRMGRPKWALDFRGIPHAHYLHDLLTAHCDRVFLSIRPDQSHVAELTAREHLVDRFQDLGPAGGILTAMTTYPDAAWLVLACDLPFVDDESITTLLRAREALRFATCFVRADGQPEPLCALYEPKARLRLFQLVALGRPRPRELLATVRTGTVEGVDARTLMNANSQGEYEEAVARLRSEGGGA